jgi:hypothetical protein
MRSGTSPAARQTRRSCDSSAAWSVIARTAEEQVTRGGGAGESREIADQTRRERVPHVADPHGAEVHGEHVEGRLGRSLERARDHADEAVGAVGLQDLAITANAPEPESGRRSAIGSASAGKPIALVNGSSAPMIRSSAPDARNIPTATRITTR